MSRDTHQPPLGVEAGAQPREHIDGVTATRARPAGEPPGRGELVQDTPGGVRRSHWVPVVSYLVTVFVLITLNFAVPRLMPGDPISVLLSQSSPIAVVDDEVRADLARYYNLDDPVLVQYGRYLTNLAQGDLGTSIYSQQSVASDLLARAPWTFLLLSVSMVLSLLIGLPAGIHSAWKRNRGVDRGLLGFFLSVQNLPIYFIGALALLLFAANLEVVPLSGATTPFAEHGVVGTVLDVAHHLALPATLMALEFAAFQYLVMRSAMVGELGSDYMLGGRAKGLTERRLKYRYAGRNALLPVVTVVGLQFGLGVTSSIFVEEIFAYPGVGLYMFNAVFQRDYPAIQGAFLLMTITVLTVNLLVDLLYRRLDPRTAG